jgi:hypothetical protein
VPFHVEVRTSLRRAWLFNLDGEALRHGILAAWSAGAVFEVAGHRWDPRETTLLILEGPQLEPPELAHGQGWNAARRSGRDVTRDVLAAGSRRAGTVVSATLAGHERGAALLSDLGLVAVEWRTVRAALLAGADAGVDTALVMAIAEPGPWLFDAGLVLGALGDHALVLAEGPRAPHELAGVAVLPADADVLERIGLRRSRAPG